MKMDCHILPICKCMTGAAAQQVHQLDLREITECNNSSNFTCTEHALNICEQQN